MDEELAIDIVARLKPKQAASILESLRQNWLQKPDNENGRKESVTNSGTQIEDQLDSGKGGVTWT